MSAAAATTQDGAAPTGPSWLAGALPIALHLLAFIGLATLIPDIEAGEIVVFHLNWIPSLEIGLTFLVDGLSLIFGLLISGIGVIIALYSARYLQGHHHFGRFFFYLCLFSFAMLGLVLAGNLITLFVFWELTTIASYLLVGFDHRSEKARRSALQALLVTGGGGLALLAGFILLGIAGGSFDMVELLNAGDVVRGDPLYLGILILVLVGAFTKSAQVPFHFWLPNAMAAPTPVSAYLHSATMVKGGVYLLARLHPVLSGTDEWIWTLTLFGATTAILASVLALRQTDLKLALAYTTLMALGTLTMFLGAEASVAIAAAVTFLLVHGLYKASLFLVVGSVDFATGSRDVDRLAGLMRAMPLVAFAAFASAFSMAGFPPFLGFIGKELKYEGALAIASEPMFVVAVAVTANALMVAAAGVIALRPFLGRPTAETPAVRRKVPWQLWSGPLLLAVLGLAFGLSPSLIDESLIQPAVTAILGQPEVIKLKLWHGVNLPLMLSILTVLLGVVLFLLSRRLRAAMARFEAAYPFSADRAWDAFLAGLIALAEFQTRILQSGVLRYYALTILATLGLVGGATLVVFDILVLPGDLRGLLFKEWVILGLMAGGGILAAMTRSRLTAICGLSAVGVGVALVFLTFGAPDVAITQLLVETLTVVLVAAAMLRLPRWTSRSPFTWRWQSVRVVTAGLAGLVTSITLLAVLSQPLDRRLSDFFEEASVPEAFGRNIVNVILVDFRALDTFGEIAVVAIAAIAAFALIRRSAGTDREQEPTR